MLNFTAQFQDHLVDYAREAKRLATTLVAFNYRGVGASTGQPANLQQLVTDGIAEVQRLLDEMRVQSTHIILDGISLGGAVATLVARHFHQKGLPINLWNDRSLSTLSKAATSMIAPEIPGLLGTMSKRAVEGSVSSVLTPSGWDANVAEAYRAIPAMYKGYMVVAKLSAHSAGDGIIGHRASLHRAVIREEKQTGIKTGHKVLSRGLFGGHNEPRRNLISKRDHSVNGQILFDNFVRSHQPH